MSCVYNKSKHGADEKYASEQQRPAACPDKKIRHGRHIIYNAHYIITGTERV